MNDILENCICDLKTDYPTYKNFLVSLKNNNLKSLEDILIDTPHLNDFFSFTKSLFRLNFGTNQKDALNLFFKNYITNETNNQRKINAILIFEKRYQIKKDDSLVTAMKLLFKFEYLKNTHLIVSGVAFFKFYNEHYKHDLDKFKRLWFNFDIYEVKKEKTSLYVFIRKEYKDSLIKEGGDLINEEEAIGIRINNLKKFENITDFEDTIKYYFIYLYKEIGIPIDKDESVSYEYTEIIPALKEVFFKTKNHDWIFYQLGHGCENSINGLTFEEYRDELKFFNDHLSVFTFLSISCYSTGLNLFTIYQGIDKMKLFKTNFNILHLGGGDIVTRNIVDFDDFFKIAKKSKKISFDEIRNLIKRYEGIFIPFFRPANREYFIPIEPSKEKKIKIITYRLNVIHELEKSDIVIRNLKFLLIATNKIHPTLDMKGTEPDIVSIYPGDSVHFIRKIVTSTLSDFIKNAFFRYIEHYRPLAKKFFFIKKIKFNLENIFLQLKYGNHTVENVIIIIKPNPLFYFIYKKKEYFYKYHLKNKKFLKIKDGDIFRAISNELDNPSPIGYKIINSDLYLLKRKKSQLPLIYGKEEYRWYLRLISSLPKNRWDILWAKLGFWEDDYLKTLKPILDIETIYKMEKKELDLKQQILDKIDVLLISNEIHYIIDIIIKEMSFQEKLISNFREVIKIFKSILKIPGYSKEKIFKHMKLIILKKFNIVRFIKENIITDEKFYIKFESILKRTIQKREFEIFKKYLKNYLNVVLEPKLKIEFEKMKNVIFSTINSHFVKK